MLIEVKGVVVRVVDLSGNDKLLTVFTEEKGLVSAVANGSKSLKSRYLSSAQLFCYASFVLESRKDRYWVREVELIENFFDIRLDIEKTALANYISEVASDTVVPEQPEPQLLRLTLNALYAISVGKYPLSHIKAAFEFRAAAILGFQPDLSGCATCGDVSGDMLLDVMNGGLLCTACHETLQRQLPVGAEESFSSSRAILCVLTPAVRRAIDYVCECPIERFLSFRLAEEDVLYFQRAAEEYLLNHLERGFRSLQFYKEVERHRP